jgi:hypothetical protein
MPRFRLNDIAQRLLRAVQGEAIVIIQTIVLQHAFKFQQLGENGVPIHVPNVVDSTTCVIRLVERAHGTCVRSYMTVASCRATIQPFAVCGHEGNTSLSH